MPKKIISLVLITMLTITSFVINAQNRAKSNGNKVKAKQECTVSGVVRFKYNDYLGYKVDLGANVIAVPVNYIDSILSPDEIVSYEKLAEKQFEYARVQNEFKKEGLSGDLANMVMTFTKSDSDRVDELDKKMVEAFVKAKSKKSGIALVDASGTYSMSVPYGEYYILFKSKNRERATASEITGRIHFERVKLSSPTELIECDFDY